MLTTSTATLSSFVNVLLGYLNMLTTLLAGLALLIFFYGLVRFVANSGDQKGHQQGRDLIKWGLVAMFIIFSLYGILRFLEITFLGGPVGSTLLPPT